jgi:hypothetical protein
MLILTLMFIAIASGLAWIFASLIFHVAWAGLHFFLPIALICGVVSLVMRFVGGHRSTA